MSLPGNFIMHKKLPFFMHPNLHGHHSQKCLCSMCGFKIRHA